MQREGSTQGREQERAAASRAASQGQLAGRVKAQQGVAPGGWGEVLGTPESGTTCAGPWEKPERRRGTARRGSSSASVQRGQSGWWYRGWGGGHKQQQRGALGGGGAGGEYQVAAGRLVGYRDVGRVGDGG